mmetsp:Transcript_58178/g.186909  ORF Transcript_58178/g.186909 Transcript_58178/m.186909 type:complete len:271 (-) Transcript_58178:187-999(-)
MSTQAAWRTPPTPPATPALRAPVRWGTRPLAREPTAPACSRGCSPAPARTTPRPSSWSWTCLRGAPGSRPTPASSRPCTRRTTSGERGCPQHSRHTTASRRRSSPPRTEHRTALRTLKRRPRAALRSRAPLRTRLVPSLPWRSSGQGIPAPGLAWTAWAASPRARRPVLAHWCLEPWLASACTWAPERTAPLRPASAPAARTPRTAARAWAARHRGFARTWGVRTRSSACAARPPRPWCSCVALWAGAAWSLRSARPTTRRRPSACPACV